MKVLCYEVSDRVRAVPHGGLGAVQRLVAQLHLTQRIDDDVHVLKVHRPSHESDQPAWVVIRSWGRRLFQHQMWYSGPPFGATTTCQRMPHDNAWTLSTSVTLTPSRDYRHTP